MMSCVAAVVRVMPHSICGVSMRAVSIENGSGGSSPGCISTAPQSIVVPSSRGGVPVLSRPSAKPSRSSVSDRPTAGASPTRPAGVWLLADMDQAAQEGAGGQHRGAAGELAAVGQADARHRALADHEIVDLALDHGEIRGLADRPLHRLGVKLAVGLRARPAHRRSLAAIEHAELDAGLVGDAAHQAVERIDLAHQMALAEPADRRVARHRADGREPVRDQRGVARPCGRPRPRPRSRRVRRRSRSHRRKSCRFVLTGRESNKGSGLAGTFRTGTNRILAVGDVSRETYEGFIADFITLF